MKLKEKCYFFFLILPVSILALTITFFPILGIASEKKTEKKENPVVLMKTTLGEIEIELYPEKAPESVKNFLAYVNSNYYSGLIFHRVMPGFMIQGGGFSSKMLKKSTHPPIKNEAGNGLDNDRGTLAMARTQEINSATSQFFINLADNNFLNHRDNTARGFGYAVFGKVIKGMDVVDEIAKVKTTNTGPFQNVPESPVTIIFIKEVN